MRRTTRVALHLANAGDDATVRWWFDNAKASGIPYDVIGLSYYGYWHGSPAAARTTLDDVPPGTPSRCSSPRPPIRSPSPRTTR